MSSARGAELESFSPMGWIDAAINAGLMPMVLVFSDGLRQLRTIERRRGAASAG